MAPKRPGQSPAARSRSGELDCGAAHDVGQVCIPRCQRCGRRTQQGACPQRGQRHLDTPLAPGMGDQDRSGVQATDQRVIGHCGLPRIGVGSELERLIDCDHQREIR
jgi:hypothetical protein